MSEWSQKRAMARDNWNALQGRGLADHWLTLALSPPFGGAYRNHGPRAEKRVALTFDDGPNRPSTELLLDTLDELGVPATFFVVGVNARNHPDLVRRAYDAGHAIGSHSWEHRRKAGLMPVGGAHIDDAAQAISEIIGQSPRLYRPPWGWLSPFEAARLYKRGYTPVGWDVYTRDWQIPEPDGIAMAEKAILETRPGSILLFHDGFPLEARWEKTQTVAAVKHLVPALQAQGYRFTTVAELLGVPAYSAVSDNSFAASLQFGDGLLSERSSNAVVCGDPHQKPARPGR